MYTSTRSKIKIPSSLAIINGISTDGGLYVKDIDKEYSLSDLKNLLNLSYQELALKIFNYYFEDIPYHYLKDVVYKAYDNKFDINSIVKMQEVKDCYFLELFHGPTKAFKDVALSALPLLMDISKRIQGKKEKTIILTATSGDTGSAALCGFNDSEDSMMVVLYPTQGVSPIQEKQMLSFASDRLKIRAIDGNFDDAQSIVKKMFNDTSLSTYTKYPLSSANSINIGRLVPQIVYYFYSYFELVRNEKINMGDKINFVVPTGNFGNILACFLSKKMGLPINKLICASNENKVLTDFFNNSEYNKNRELIKTSSPSMDILISSNLERLLYYLTNSQDKVKEMMINLENSGIYDLDDDLKNKLNEFYGNYCDQDETIDMIKKVYQENDYLIDPHTAVGYGVYQKYKKDTLDNTLTIVASTASPFKFPNTVAEALEMNKNENVFELINDISLITKLEIPEMIKKINKDYQKIVWNKKEAYKDLIELLKELNNNEKDNS